MSCIFWSSNSFKWRCLFPRLLSSASGLYQQHAPGLDILQNLWTKIVVEPLSKEELSQVRFQLLCIFQL